MTTPDAAMLFCREDAASRLCSDEFASAIRAGDYDSKDIVTVRLRIYRAGQAHIAARLRELGLIDALQHIARKARDCADSYRHVPALAHEAARIERSLELVFAHIKAIDEAGEL